MIKCSYSEQGKIKEFTECSYPEECEKKIVYGFKNYCTPYQKNRDESKKLEKKLDQN